MKPLGYETQPYELSLAQVCRRIRSTTEFHAIASANVNNLVRPREFSLDNFARHVAGLDHGHDAFGAHSERDGAP